MKRTFLLAAAFAVIALTGCKGGAYGTTDIKRLLDDPSQYDHKTVRIAGTVTHAIGLMGYGGYTVDDGTGSLPIVSEGNGAPREGAKVGVQGEFRSAFTFQDKSVAVIIEKNRQTY
jgi:hypothetical protein